MSARADALRKLLSGEDPLDLDDCRRLRAGAAAFVDALLLTGDCAAALEELKARNGGELPAAPATLGGRTLRGMTRLDFEPYETRAYIDQTCRILSALALDARDAEVVPWLLQLLKVAFPGDRRTPLAAIAALELAPERIRDAAADFFESLAAQSYAPPASPADHASDLLGGLASPVWRAALLRAGAALPDDRLEALGSDFALRFFDSTRGWGSCAELGIGDDELADWLSAPVPPARAAFGLAAARLQGRLGAQSALRARGLISAALAGADPLPFTLIADAAECLEKARALDSADAPGLKSDLEALAARPDVYAKRRAVEALDNLVEGLQDRGAPLLSADFKDDALTVWRTPALLTEPRLSADGRGTVPYRRVKARATSSEWMTAEDEIGVFGVDAAVGAVEAFVLPVRFRMRAAGAAGAQRSLRLLGDLPGRGELLLGVESPFSRSGRWGTENLLFSWSPARRAWTFWGPRTDGGLASPEPLDPARVVDEEELPPVCFGELVVSPRGELIEDLTPHHLDSYSGPDVHRPLPGLAGRNAPFPASPWSECEPPPAAAAERLASRGLHDAYPFARSGAVFLFAGSHLNRDGWIALLR